MSGKDIVELANVLKTTLAIDDVDVMVYSSTGDRLYTEYVAPGLPLNKTIYNLLIELERIGITCIFLSEVHRQRPDRPDVRAAIERFCPQAPVLPSPEAGPSLSVQRSGEVQPDQPGTAFAPGLQRNVRPLLHKLDIHVWLQRLTEIEQRVCRIEYDGRSVGTGFIVGPDVVLTNWHVVETAKAAGRLDALTCRFDYVALADGTRRPGVLARLHADGLIDASPYSRAEKAGDPAGPPPGADELDYALLRLAEPPGRGWIALPSAAVPLDAGGPLLIVQHPDGGPMKLAMDTQAVIGRVADDLRLRYRTNTDPGSSGSPCFTMDWDLVAVHHFGDPAWREPRFNQGIPAELIRARIVAQGHGAMLAA